MGTADAGRGDSTPGAHTWQSSRAMASVDKLILRAGNGLLEGMLDLVPSARVAQKVARDPSAVAVRYAMHDPSESLLVVRTHAG